MQKKVLHYGAHCFMPSINWLDNISFSQDVPYRITFLIRNQGMFEAA